MNQDSSQHGGPTSNPSPTLGSTIYLALDEATLVRLERQPDRIAMPTTTSPGYNIRNASRQDQRDFFSICEGFKGLFTVGLSQHHLKMGILNFLNPVRQAAIQKRYPAEYASETAFLASFSEGLKRKLDLYKPFIAELTMSIDSLNTQVRTLCGRKPRILEEPTVQAISKNLHCERYQVRIYKRWEQKVEGFFSYVQHKNFSYDVLKRFLDSEREILKIARKTIDERAQRVM